jgi:hypothetical protein
MATEFKTVTLNNGSIEAEGLVAVTMISLMHLVKDGTGGMLAAYDLVMRCRDGSYQFFGDNEEKLKAIGLVERDGNVHSSVRNIVLSAAKGDGMDMTFGSPVRPTSAAQPPETDGPSQP